MSGQHKIEQWWYVDHLAAECDCGAAFECQGNDESARNALRAWVGQHRKEAA